MGVPEKIQAIQDEIHKTQINKATEFHIGILKAKIAKLKKELEENTHGKPSQLVEEMQVLMLEKPEMPLSYLLDFLVLGNLRY